MALTPRIRLVAIPILVIGAGIGSLYGHLLPAPQTLAAHLPGYHAARVDPDPPITAKTAVTITMPAVESNLGSNGHYIQVVVSFNVTESALAKASATAPTSATASSGNLGTTSVALNNRLEAMITSVARMSHYAALQTPAGVAAFSAVILHHLQQMFGRTQVDDVLFPTLITQ